ncbi:MAG: hypothetical protein KDI88_05070 [Gammaproteobacteria bacterium]|nr:hypothetical protein [Gammaproteobacteria bacterium]
MLPLIQETGVLANAGFLVSAAGSGGDVMRDENRTDWQALDSREQLALREAYGHYLDTLPPTCDLAEKNERFRRWLAERGVEFEVDR